MACISSRNKSRNLEYFILICHLSVEGDKFIEKSNQTFKISETFCVCIDFYPRGMIVGIGKRFGFLRLLDSFGLKKFELKCLVVKGSKKEIQMDL